MRKLFSLLIILSILISGCNLPSTGGLPQGGSGDPQAWIDKPLPGTRHPLAPVEIMAHASDLGGIKEFELSVNDQVVQTGAAANPDVALGNVLIQWVPEQPGRYVLKVRASNASGSWGPYVETYIEIEDKPWDPQVQVDPVIPATGQVGGGVFSDQNGDGLQDANEVPLDGVLVVLKGCGQQQSVVTGADGTFQFSNLPSGSCTLEVEKGGWVYSGSYPPAGYPIAVASDLNLPTNIGILMANVSKTASQPQFGAPQLSGNSIYYGASRCEPGSVSIQIMAQHPDGIKVVVFFHLLDEVDGGSNTGWSEGLSMNPVGNNDLYQLNASGNTLVGDTGFNTQAVVSYQFVMQTLKGEYFRSPVYADLFLSPCGSPPIIRGGVTSTPGIIILPPIIIKTVTPSVPIPH